MSRHDPEPLVRSYLTDSSHDARIMAAMDRPIDNTEKCEHCNEWDDLQPFKGCASRTEMLCRKCWLLAALPFECVACLLEVAA